MDKHIAQFQQQKAYNDPSPNLKSNIEEKFALSSGEAKKVSHDLRYSNSQALFMTINELNLNQEYLIQTINQLEQKNNSSQKKQASEKPASEESPDYRVPNPSFDTEGGDENLPKQEAQEQQKPPV